MTVTQVRSGVCTGDGPCDSTPFSASTTDNWVARAGGLPLYIRAIAKALRRKGMSDSQAISTAVATAKHWASGGGNVTAATRARAAKAVAEWEAKKASAHGGRDAGGIVTEAGSAGTLLPVGPSPKVAAAVEARLAGLRPHAFRGSNLASCAKCRKPAADPIHTKTVAGARASGAYASGHPFYGNQYAVLNNAQTPQQLSQLVAALAAMGAKGWTTAPGGHASKKVAGGKSKGGAKSSAKKAAAHQKALANRKARQEAAYKKGAAAAEAKAARDRLLAAHAKTASAKARYLARAKAYQDLAAKFQAALAKLEGHRHAGAGHQAVPTGHVAGNPVRTRRAHKLAFNAAADQVEGRLRQAMLAVFAQQEKRALAALNGGRGRKLRSAIRAGQQPPDDGQPTPAPSVFDIFDTTWAAEQTAEALAPIYQLASRLAQETISRQLAAGEPISTIGTVAQNVENRVNQLAGQVTQTTFDQIQQAIRDGIAAGDSTTQIADAVRHVFDVARARAELIARTETSIALNQAAFDYAQASGKVGRKEWLAVHDTRTRETHRVADGQTVPVGLPFAVGGSLMMHPGDPTAPPGEVCNCRCSVLYHPAAKGDAGGITAPALGGQAA